MGGIKRFHPQRNWKYILPVFYHLVEKRFILKGIESHSSFSPGQYHLICFILKGIESWQNLVSLWKIEGCRFILKGIESLILYNHLLASTSTLFHPQRNWKLIKKVIIVNVPYPRFILKGIESYFTKSPIPQQFTYCFILKGIESFISLRISSISLFAVSSSKELKVSSGHLKIPSAPVSFSFILKGIERLHRGAVYHRLGSRFHPQRNWKFNVFRPPIDWEEVSSSKELKVQ